MTAKCQAALITIDCGRQKLQTDQKFGRRFIPGTKLKLDFTFN